MNLEKVFAQRVYKAIEIEDDKNLERYYNHYLLYTRNIIKDFDKDLQDYVTFKYAEYISKDL